MVRIVNNLEDQANLSGKQKADIDKRKAKNKKCNLKKMFGLALCDRKNSIYFYKTKMKRKEAARTLRLFNPGLRFLPDNYKI